jgi:hypothetical protein
MADIESAADKSTEQVFLDVKGADQSGEARDKFGVFAGGEGMKRTAIRNKEGLAGAVNTDEFRNNVREPLRRGATVNVNADDERLDPKEKEVLKTEARNNQREGGKGHLRVVDAHSSQATEFTNEMKPVGVDAVTHERTFNVIAGEQDEKKKAASPKAPDAGLRGKEAAA